MWSSAFGRRTFEGSGPILVKAQRSFAALIAWVPQGKEAPSSIVVWVAYPK